MGREMGLELEFAGEGRGEAAWHPNFVLCRLLIHENTPNYFL